MTRNCVMKHHKAKQRQMRERTQRHMNILILFTGWGTLSVTLRFSVKAGGDEVNLSGILKKGWTHIYAAGMTSEAVSLVTIDLKNIKKINKPLMTSPTVVRTHAEVGSNTSTAALRVVQGEGKGTRCLGVQLDHPVTGGYKYGILALQVGGVSTMGQQNMVVSPSKSDPWMTALARPSSNYKRQTRPLVSGGAPHNKPASVWQ
jgi:hypothetical protein